MKQKVFAIINHIDRQRRRVALWWKRMDRQHRPWWRIANGMFALLILVTALMPVLQTFMDTNRYSLSDETLRLVGSTQTSLTKQLTHDSKTNTYHFNASALKEFDPLSQLQNSVGTSDGEKNKSLYALDVPADIKKGVTYHDINSQLSFTLKPNFDGLDGKLTQQRIVFPLSGGAQAVYSLKNNGLKEDIIIEKATEDTMKFSYTLDLPKTLTARLLDDGGIGVYGPNPALLGNVSASDAKDQALLQKARESSEKDYLIFGLPAPIIATKDGAPKNAAAHFELKDNTLSVVAEGLTNIEGAFSIDPSVVVTSASDFQNGNDEGNISFGTAGQVTRSSLTGGTVGAWGITTPNPVNSKWLSATVYAGYVYTLGHYNGGMTDVCRYAALNSNGTLGTWQTCTPLTTLRDVIGFTAYNGKLYLAGGNNAGVETSLVEYATINPVDGSIGSWVATTSLPVALGFGQSFAYNNYIYYVGGTLSSGNAQTTNYYAQIKADGTIGSWTTTASLPAARAAFGLQQYNGYVYVMGGTADYNLSGTPYNTVFYTKINTDGTLATWQTGPTLLSTVAGPGTAVYGGYLYVMGGFIAPGESASATSAVSYAQINSNGSLGSWRATRNLATARGAAQSFTNGGYLYTMNGETTASAILASVEYAKIDPPGTATPYTTSANTYALTGRGSQTVLYDGYMYVMGGDNGSTPRTTIYTAPVNSDGTIGTFTTTGMTAFTTARTFFAAVAYNGNMYVLGGCSSAYASCTTAANNSTNVLKSTIGANGTLGAWSTQTSFSTGRYGHGALAINNTIYIMGGINGSTFRNDIQYSVIGPGGTLGSWTTSARTISTARAYFGLATSGKYMYLAGGCTAGAITCTTTQNDVQYAQLSTSGWAAGDLASNFTATGNGSFTTTRGMLGLTAMNGYLYIAGGRSNTTYYADTQFAPINANGTVGTWVSSFGSTLATTRAGIGIVGSNGFIYVTGGTNGTAYYNNVQYAATNNGGGNIQGSWAATGATVSGCSGTTGNNSVVAYNGYVYAGARSAGCDFMYAQINSDGTIGSWVSLGADPQHGDNGSLLVSGGYIYSLGGYDCVSWSLDVCQTSHYASINSDGTIGSWSLLSAPPIGVQSAGSATYNGYLYIVGGYPELSLVSHAKPGANGDVESEWSTTEIPTVIGATVVAYNGYLYILGGAASSGGVPETSVMYMPINSDGTLGTLQYGTPMVKSLYTTVTAANGFMYVTGGSLNDPTGASARVTSFQYASINSDGSIGSWHTSGAQLPVATMGGQQSSFVYNDYIYLHNFSPSNNGPGADRFYHAPLNVPPRASHYSKQIDLLAKSKLNSIAYNGTLSGKSNITYRSAKEDGVYGATKKPISTSIVNASPCTNMRYVQIFITIDDSQKATFPDGANNSYVTDVTAGYSPMHPETSIRLRHGKTLQLGSLAPHDTC